MSDKMREAFEKWYMTNTFAHIDHISVFYNDLNCYPAPIANHCWKAWQAAQSVSVPVVGNVVAWGVTKRHEDNVWFISDSRFTAQYYAQMYAHRIGENPDQVVIPLYRKPATSITADELERLRKDAAKVLHAEQIRIAAVAAIREVTGCPDIKGKDGAYLVDALIVNLLEPKP